jgi:hypothetical protein
MALPQQANINLIRRSADNTGGTSTALTIVPLDSSNAAATAAARFYTAAPTLGTLVGPVASARLLFNAAGSGTLEKIPLVFNFSGQSSQQIVLRGVSQILSINMSAVAGNFTPTLSGYIWFTEE